jgi:NADPH:quinone reductase-like Zn-dependent oxidoreductase
MPNAIVMTAYGPPEVLKWASVPLREPGEGQIRIKVKAAGISPTDLALRAGYVKEVFPLPPNAVLGGGGSVGIIATQLAVARGIKVISAVGEQDETLARELGATPVRYGAGVAGRVRALGAVDAVFDAAGKGVLAEAIALAGGPRRVITLADPAAADFGVTFSQYTSDRAPGALDETMALLAAGRLRLRAHTSMPMQQAALAHRQLESGTVHERIILTLQ